MVFGFGERALSIWRGQDGSGEMLAALFPSKSAILMTALTRRPTEAFADHGVVTLRLPQDRLARIAERGSGTGWRSIPTGRPCGWRRSLCRQRVLCANETYDAFHTCNTWTALLLRDAGVPVDTHVLFAGQVMRQVARSRRCRPATDDQQGGARVPLSIRTARSAGLSIRGPTACQGCRDRNCDMRRSPEIYAETPAAPITRSMNLRAAEIAAGSVIRSIAARSSRDATADRAPAHRSAKIVPSARHRRRA